MSFSTTLIRLFDYQIFMQNPRLSRLIDEADEEFRTPSALSDDELDIWAAGDPDMSFLNDPKENDDD